MATAPPDAAEQAVAEDKGTEEIEKDAALPAAASPSEANVVAAAAEREPEEPRPGPESDNEPCPLFAAVGVEKDDLAVAEDAVLAIARDWIAQDPTPRLSGKIQPCAAVCLTRQQQRDSTR